MISEKEANNNFNSNDFVGQAIVSAICLLGGIIIILAEIIRH